MGTFGGDGRLLAGRYRLGERLGRGGMGTVWRATDELLRREVAVKELHLTDALSAAQADEQRQRTLREARTVAQLKHPNVIVLHDVVEEDGRPWIVMELVDGRSLADALAADGPVGAREAARIGVAMLGALRAAHAQGVLHRDIKPPNVLMEAGTGRIVLTDFGIAQVSGVTTITETGAFVGSPEYTAPERMSGRTTGPQSDLWSMGVLLCAALSGESPFRRDSLGGILHAVVYDEIRPPVAAGELLPVVRGLLERDPERRMGAEEAEGRLRAYLRTGRMPVLGRPYAPTQAGVPVPVAPSAVASSSAATRIRRSFPRLPAASPEALSPEAAQATRSNRARVALMAAVAVVALAGVGAGFAALMLGGGEGGGSGSTSGSASGAPSAGTSTRTSGQPTGDRTGHTTPPASKPSDSKPSDSKPSDSKPPASELAPGPSARVTVPVGYHMVRDPAGFTLAVPDGFTRSFEPPRVFYYAPGKAFRLGVHIQDQRPEGPMGAMRTSHAEGAGRYPGYRSARVERFSRAGRPAALWEFTWNGFDEDAGPRHTYDLTWNEGGKMYDVWVSSPAGEAAAGRRHFDTALDTFVRTEPDSAHWAP
ncbi:serine/threonine-protein kinase [Streptomyces sp. NPDC050610]|uniref:serine/threonine-protein kinase n=1 Tax=Streptomyces sp. NPDC050610 TaxID=3157097 RepID=UPI0034428568